ncbi:diguanylate cyclase [Alkalidesulfovibrio alkalitolerans DSM 16529]|uniref:diguanylate cyclase n=1 Tax=Alkalidesulfovibrio alkalitolerans DSM 16529 TaxID=1121439 RepID=S7UMA8_9BACT|nr:GGDEF domain-containing protein [Alkalidesulfovibrio alkalitolerans]EPR35084.1 diguanylate cyclase [Alkalidesulfovibrio alkalitolerans DSM 16529]
MTAQRLHYAATAALLFVAVLLGFATCYKSMLHASRAERTQSMAMEQQQRVLMLAALVQRADDPSRSQTLVETRRLLEAQDALTSGHPDSLSLPDLDRARKLLAENPFALDERTRRFADAVRAIAASDDAWGRPSPRIDALVDKAVDELAEGFGRLALVAVDANKEEQRRLLQLQYAFFLAVAAILLYQFFVIVRPLSLQAEKTLAALNQARERLDACVGHDDLTGLFNRLRLEEALSREIVYVQSYGTKLSAVCLDVDHFKEVNSALGQLGGNEVLKSLAELLQGKLTKADALYRFSGEKFVILAPHVGLKQAAVLAEKLRRLVAGHVFPHKTRLTISLGVAECRADEDMEAFLARLNAAVRTAREKGMNRVAAG